MSGPDAIDDILLILECLVLFINLCERGYKAYKAYKARKEEKQRMKAWMAWNGDSLDNSSPRMGWEANSCRMSHLHHQNGQGDCTREISLSKEVEETLLYKDLERFSDEQLAALDDKQLDAIEDELFRDFKLAKMKRLRRD
ncbi:hypothetical protein FOCG_15956 [Fusarium oxysporum f. sp. radicis-lycopersici 26381]|nr:hypothetical protein FOWG_14680 [Fusarium oxysporum f. sp. lycopersici MN25]EXL41805.1 hypothetical protein FOCG_15956 [Fusarium oxysporum f. sp. radicis-lycopersici 26381]KAJ4128612.1 hypothetical protein NW765_013000 [Fusarium oxysporum]KAJ4273660.1 hypothetical protein NW764_012206 [Fusarium oxysporum]